MAAVKAAEAAGCQVVTVAMLGHKCDVAVMAVHENLRELRAPADRAAARRARRRRQLRSLTEVSEYARAVPDEMKKPRLYPQLPPNHGQMPACCFYPMSKKRGGDANWFTLPYERAQRADARARRQRAQVRRSRRPVITGSTGLDDFEWGVTLFAVRPDDLKEVVYTMRFDEASAVYAEFGPFYTGMVTPVEELMASL